MHNEYDAHKALLTEAQKRQKSDGHTNRKQVGQFTIDVSE